MKKLPVLFFCLLLTAALLTAAAPTAARADVMWDPTDELTNPVVLANIGITLAFVIIIEVVFARLCRHRGRALLLVALLNLLTNPIILTVLELGLLIRSRPSSAVFVLELVAVLLEGLIYRKSRLGFSRPYVFSLAANALSFGLLLLFHVIL